MPQKISGLISTLALTLTVSFGQGQAQNVSHYLPVTAGCKKLNQDVLTLAANGRFDRIESALSSASVSDPNSPEPSCAGFVLCNVATFLAESGRLADAEMFAERSLHILEKNYPPDDAVLMPTLQTLVCTRFETGKRAKAREAFERMRSLRMERPAQRALVHGMAAALAREDGRYSEAATEYSAALDAWVAAGRGRTADAAVTLIALGSVYLEDRKFSQAQQALDRALDILTIATDAIPMDRIRLLGNRSALHARQGQWPEAERDLQNALTIADSNAKMNPDVLQSLLTNYAVALRKNHHKGEARTIERRIAALHRDRPAPALVDVADLLPKSKPAGR